MKKTYIYIVISALLIQNLFFGFVFAQNQQPTTQQCMVCGMPSLEFQSYVNFQVEMLGVLEKAFKEEEKKIDNRTFGLFSSRILSLPAKMWESWKRMFQKSAEDMTKASRAARVGTAILGSVTKEIALKDGIGGLVILTRNRPFVRDWKTLQELDMSMHDVMRDLGMKGVRDQKVSNEVRNGFLEIQKKHSMIYGNEYALFESFDFSDVKYKDIVTVMLKLNAVMKTFLSIHSNIADSDFFKNHLWRIESEIGKGNIKFKFNMILVTKMFEHYKCAQGFNACSNFGDLFKKNISIFPILKDGFSEAMTTIKDANKDFSEAYLQNNTKNEQDNIDKRVAQENNLTEKQIALLRTVYGIDTSKITQNQGFGISTLLNRSLGKNLVNSVNFQTLDILSAESIAARKEAQKIRQQNRQDQRYLLELKEKHTKESNLEAKKGMEDEIIRLTAIMDGNISFGSDRELKNTLIKSVDISLSQKNEDKQQIFVYSNLSTTRHFWEIGKLIHNIMDEYIGTKDSSGLVKYLGKTCELQCTNKGVASCYVK